MGKRQVTHIGDAGHQHVSGVVHDQEAVEKPRHFREYKMQKYLDACIQQQHRFSLSVISVDSLLFTEADTTLKRLSRRLATN